jgi:hypothetical protein
MSNQNVFSTPIVTWVAVSSLAMLLGAGPARAQDSSANYTFLVGSGFLCDPGDSATCPAVVKSANDDRYDMSGAGMFNAQSKSVTAAGTYTHESSDGTVLETGVWIVSQLVSFDSYGFAPGVLRVRGQTVGLSPFGPKRLPKPIGPMATGGLAVFHIRLLPVEGGPKIAVLEVNCAIGKVPTEHQVEGVRLKFEDSSPEFDEEVSGHTLFVLTRPGASAPGGPRDAAAAP